MCRPRKRDSRSLWLPPGVPINRAACNRCRCLDASFSLFVGETTPLASPPPSPVLVLSCTAGSGPQAGPQPARTVRAHGGFRRKLLVLDRQQNLGRAVGGELAVRLPVGTKEVHQGNQDGFRGHQEAGRAEGAHRVPQGGHVELKSSMQSTFLLYSHKTQSASSQKLVSFRPGTGRRGRPAGEQAQRRPDQLGRSESELGVIREKHREPRSFSAHLVCGTPVVGENPPLIRHKCTGFG